MTRSDAPSWRIPTDTKKYKNNRREKLSVGIACCRYINGKYEILMVKKRFTYAFNVFVLGRYNPIHSSEIIDLFSGMTIEEKLDIMSLNFQHIWYRLWLNNPPGNTCYFSAKSKFDNTFLPDGGVRLQRLIANSSNYEYIWEIPKGKKKNKAESNIHCALREFSEETGIMKSAFRIFPWAYNTYSYVDMGIKYTNIYYIALMTDNIPLKINFKLHDQLEEISDIRWMDIDAIKYIDHTKRLTKFIRPIFKFVKKYK